MEKVWVDEVVPQCLHRKRRVFPRARDEKKP